ncbi:MAG: FGGY-family carbohydrate kinase [Pirellulales bacterium]
MKVEPWGACGFSKTFLFWLFQQCRGAWKRMGKEFSWSQLVDMARASKPLQSLIQPDDTRFVAPENMVEAIQSFYRDTHQTVLEEPGAIARSCLESLALRYRACLGWLEELLGYRLETIHIVGGGVQNQLLCQMTADACNRQVIAGPVEATAIGNIMMQAVGLGRLASIVDARQLLRSSPDIQTYHPNPTVDWDEAFHRECLQ